MQEKRPRSTTISSTTVSSMPPGAPGALPVLPLGMCWQLQDGPDYHLSWGRGQGRLRRCGGVLWAFKRRKCVEIAKRALLAHLGLEHALHVCRHGTSRRARAGRVKTLDCGKSIVLSVSAAW